MSERGNYDDLQAWLSAEDGFEPPPDGAIDLPPASIDGSGQANALLRRLGLNHVEETSVTMIADAEIARIRLWAEDRMAGIYRYRRWLEATLEQFIRAEHERRGVTTIDLPHGALSLEKPREALDNPTEEGMEALTALGLTESETVVKAPKVAVKKALKRGQRLADVPDDEHGREAWSAITEDGEVVPGVIYRLAADKVFKAVVR